MSYFTVLHLINAVLMTTNSEGNAMMARNEACHAAHLSQTHGTLSLAGVDLLREVVQVEHVREGAGYLK
jgi:hypothetical protein